MKNNSHFDIIIIGGSYAGLSAAMALGRASRKVLVIDSGNPCNKRAPRAHNFLTWDGMPPDGIRNKAKEQVKKYSSVTFLDGIASDASTTKDGFEITTEKGERFSAKKLLFATGIEDLLPEIPGLAECWGISILHCPYCHGYEVKGKTTAVLANEIQAYDLCMVLTQWTKEIMLLTNGRSALTEEQVNKFKQHRIHITETEIERVEHHNGQMQAIHFKDGSKLNVSVMYAKPGFRQQCTLPEKLGCKMTKGGHIEVDKCKKTSVHGIYAAGDNSSQSRIISMSVAAGSVAGMMLNGELSSESF
ncbi:MAG: pyridine nucleotide-disulfide oxidoreductase [Bacteroidetes bacterium]|nr:pyridine nucleotide-disulfide oxidoreductase [Bacteroidota bacterium]